MKTRLKNVARYAIVLGISHKGPVSGAEQVEGRSNIRQQSLPHTFKPSGAQEFPREKIRDRGENAIVDRLIEKDPRNEGADDGDAGSLRAAPPNVNVGSSRAVRLLSQRF
jgi:hypothetical protein